MRSNSSQTVSNIIHINKVSLQLSRDSPSCFVVTFTITYDRTTVCQKRQENLKKRSEKIPPGGQWIDKTRLAIEKLGANTYVETTGENKQQEQRIQLVAGREDIMEERRSITVTDSRFCHWLLWTETVLRDNTCRAAPTYTYEIPAAANESARHFQRNASRVSMACIANCR